jgi:ubiquinone/menaquinone biosynthesis C-methylase UbiE
MGYLEVIYDRKREPRTAYPKLLTNYLCNRFGIKKKQKLLELGTGNADLLSGFKELGIQCYGIDKELYPNVRKYLNIKRVDLAKHKLPYSNESFDFVFHKSFLEHFYVPETEFIMKETYRVLKKGGKVIVLVPDWISQMPVFFEDYTHVHPYDCLAIKDLLKINKFHNVTSERFYQLPIIWEYPWIRSLSKSLQTFISTPLARIITEKTGWKFVRWSVELMILGYGEK